MPHARHHYQAPTQARQTLPNLPLRATVILGASHHTRDPYGLMSDTTSKTSETSKEAAAQTATAPESDRPLPESLARRGTFGQILLGHQFAEESKAPDPELSSQPTGNLSSSKPAAPSSSPKKLEPVRPYK